MDSPAIGIDLGTTFSCVAVYKSGRVAIIPNNYSNRVTPSCVAFQDDGSVLAGEAAKDQAVNNPTNTVYAVKRLIGRRFSDQCVQEDMKNWPFKVVAGAGDKPMEEIKVGGFNKRFSPEEVSGHILAKMKTIAESFLGRQVKDAVITIPANYGDWQRQSTYDAARLAGLNVLRLINEPAAALAYGFDNLFSGFNRNVLVFDLGGGTLDISILAVNQRHHFEVKATAGNVHLGGEDFDTIMVNHVAEEFNRRNRQMDIMSDKKAVRRLTAVCERAKRTLSENTFVAIEIDYLHQGRDYSGKLQRTKFETLCADLFRSTLLPVTTALQQANMTKQDIHEIVLAGGSSRIPMIKKLLREYFNNRELRQTVDPEEAVAHGAAIMAAKLSGVNVDAGVRNMQLLDITGQSLGVKDCLGNMNFMISKGSSVPHVSTLTMTTVTDFVTGAVFRIYEGEHNAVVDNTYLGSFTISGFPARPKGEVCFNVKMELDESGILHVSAVDLLSGKANQITFTRRFGSSQ